MKNTMEIKFKAISENEAFARNVVASFILPLNPSLNELEDIKTAVNEANAWPLLSTPADPDSLLSLSPSVCPDMAPDLCRNLHMLHNTHPYT